MSARLAPLALLLLPACAWLTATTDEGTDLNEDDPCDNGLVTATSAVVSFGDTPFGGIGAGLDFDPEAVFRNQPAACVSADGRTAAIVITYNGDPNGFLRVSVPGPGSVGFDEGVAFLSVDLDGPGVDPALNVPTNGWVDGTLEVASVGSTFDISILSAESDPSFGEVLAFAVDITLGVPDDAGSDTAGGGPIDTSGVGLGAN